MDYKKASVFNTITISVKLVERLKRNIWIDNNVYEKYTVWNGNSPFWRYINKWPLLSKYYNKKIYHLQSHVIDDNSLYPSAAQDNLGYVSGRSLASTPLDCPTPMGMKGRYVKKKFLANRHY